jgi:hypothetical protein
LSYLYEGQKLANYVEEEVDEVYGSEKGRQHKDDIK